MNCCCWLLACALLRAHSLARVPLLSSHHTLSLALSLCTHTPHFVQHTHTHTHAHTLATALIKAANAPSASSSASALASQLSALAPASSAASKRNRRAPVSLLFADPAAAAAADLDPDAFFALGVSGLAGLSLLQSDFSPVFSNSLFSDALRNTDRMLLSRDEADSLNKLISKFLTAVSPFFLNPAAFKALEWLVYRFQIHVHNAEDLLRAALPFHDSWQFVRVLSAVKLSPKWAWLSAFRDKRVSVDRKSLVDRAIKDMDKLLIQNSPNTALCSFFTSFMVEYGHRAKMTDEILRIVMPCLFAMASTNISNVQVAAYMVVAHFSNKAPFSHAVVTATGDLIVAHASADQARYAACCLISLYDSQDVCPVLSVQFLKDFLDHSFWKTSLSEVLSVYQGNKFLMAFVDSFFLQRRNSDTLQLAAFSHFITVMPLSSDIAERVCSAVLGDMLALHSGNSTASPTDLASVKKILAHISKSFPLVLNASVASVSSSLTSDSQSEKLYSLLSSIFAGTLQEPIRQNGVNTTLFLSLQHADSEIRYMGYCKLIKMIKEKPISLQDVMNDEKLSFIPSILVAGVGNSDPRITREVLSIPNLLEFLKTPHGKNTGISELLNLAISSVDNDFEISRIVFDHMLVLMEDFSNLAIADKGRVIEVFMSYFLVEEKTTPLLEYASQKVAPFANKAGVDNVFSLFSGCDGLGKEIRQMKQKYANKSAMLKKELSDVRERMAAVIAGNVLRHDPVSFHKTFTSAAIQSDVPRARILALDVVAKLLCSPQRKLLDADDEILEFLKGRSFGSQANQIDSDGLEQMEEEGLIRTVEAIVSSLPSKKKTLESSSESNHFKLVEAKIFEVLLRSQNHEGFRHFIAEFFSSKNEAESLQFLVDLSLNDELSVAVRAQCLRLVSMILKAESSQNARKDFQVMLPGLVVSLCSESKVIREESMKCLKTVRKILAPISDKKDTSIFAFDSFYGTSSDKVQYLQSALALKFLNALLETSQECITDSEFVFRRIGELLYKKSFDVKQSDNVVTFFLSSALAAGLPSTKFHFIQMLKVVRVPLKVKILSPLFDDVFGNGEVVKHSVPDNKRLRIALIEALISTPVVNEVFRTRKGRFFQLFQRILLSSEEPESIFILSAINNEWFQCVGEQHSHIISTLVKIASGSGQSASTIAKRILRSVEYDADVLINLLLAFQESISAGEMEQPSKRARGQSGINVNINELITILEILDTATKIAYREKLVGPLFELLGTILGLDPAKFSVSLEYLKQLLISAQLRITKGMKDSGEYVDESLIRVDSIVMCIRVSENPQTHNEALLLLAELAGIYPKTVLLNVIPIFTFMGANVLRRDDDYSFHVIQQTLEAIIPAFVQKSEPDCTQRVKSIIEVFVDSHFHVPKHRRLRLFSILVTTLGAQEYLDSVVMTLLLKSSPKFSDIAAANPSDIASLMPFCLNLVQSFDTSVQLNALSSILHVVNVMCTEGFNDTESSLPTSLDTLAIDFSIWSPSELKHFALVCLEFVNSTLSGVSLAESASALLCDNFKKALAIVVQTERGNSSKVASEDSRKSFHSLLQKKLESILGHLNRLISWQSFLDMAVTLISEGDALISAKIIDLSATVFVKISSDEYSEGKQSLIVLFEKLVSLLSEGIKVAEPSPSDRAIILSSLNNASIMIKQFGQNDPKSFAGAIKVFADRNLLSSKFKQIQAAAFDCLCSCIYGFGARLVPVLKQIMAEAFVIFQNLQETSVVDEVCISAMNFLELVLSKIPQFIGPHMQDILKFMFLNGTVSGKKASIAKFHTVKREILGMVTKRASMNVLIPIFQSQASVCFNSGTDSTLEYFAVLSMTISNMQKSDLNLFLSDMTKLFLSCFEFRSRFGKLYSEQEIVKTEGSMISAFLQLVMRLNESLFKPLYFNIVDWALNGTDKNSDSLIFFLLLITSLLDKLKIIFSPYVLHIMDMLTDSLESYKRAPAADKKWELIFMILKKFLHFSSGPVSDDLFNKRCSYVTSQIDNVAMHGNNYL
ncbi:HEAT repeat-containing protein 1, partial [Entophlyctis luteolus]